MQTKLLREAGIREPETGCRKLSILWARAVAGSVMPRHHVLGTRENEYIRFFSIEIARQIHAGLARDGDSKEKFQPRPKSPLSVPASYDSESWGPTPEQPGLVAR